MSKLNAIVIATTLLFAAAAQADDAAARVAQERTALAMRSAGVEHLIPAQADAQPARQASEQVKPEAKPAADKPALAGQAALSRAAVIAELQRARRDGELDHAFAEIGYPALAGARASTETRLAAALPRPQR